MIDHFELVAHMGLDDRLYYVIFTLSGNRARMSEVLRTTSRDAAIEYIKTHLYLEI